MHLRLRVVVAGLALVAFGACGTFGSSDDPSTSDAGADGGAGLDGTIGDATNSDATKQDASSGPRCDVTKAFTSTAQLKGADALALGAPVPASSPTLTADEATVFFDVLAPDGGSQLLSSARNNSVFGAPQPVPGIPFVGVDRFPSLRLDGTLLTFMSNRDTLDPFSTRIFTAARLADGGFATPTRLVVGGGASMAVVTTPFLSADGKELYFGSYLTGDGDIYRAPALGGGAFGDAVRLDAIASPGGDENSPVLSADGLTLYFASDRADLATARATIYFARRSSITADFQLPQVVEELHDATIDRRPGWLSPDSCRLYFTATTGGSSLYVATRVPE